MEKKNLAGKKVAILGLGVEGVALVEFLLALGAKITVCDKMERAELLSAAEGELGDKIEAILEDENIAKKLGHDYLDGLESFDVIFRSPGIKLLEPKILAAQKAGVEVSSQIKLFFDLCPCPIIGVTGTKGKGTTASLIFSILENNFQFPISNFQSNPKSQIKNTKFGQVYLAGNIGYPAITLVSKLKRHDIVILELSSFQLADLDKSPHIAVMTNLLEDHLDYHKDIEEYRTAKFNILKYQNKNDFAVLNADSIFEQAKLSEIQSQKLFFSNSSKDTDAFVAPNETEQLAVYIIEGKEKIEICNSSDVLLLGSHNLQNIAAAALTARILKAPVETIREAVRQFAGLPHRLELVAEINKVKFINDSFATNPGPTLAAIKSFQEPKILILGGSSKGADFIELAEVMTQTNSNVKAVILIGVEGEKIGESLKQAKYSGEIISGGETMDEIVEQAIEVASRGDIILFSPACASFDMFKNYKDRGDKYKLSVSRLGKIE